MNAFSLARQHIDAAHSADPRITADGRPAELVYADRMEHWIELLTPNAPDLLRLAARCQHLQRWQVPRSSHPAGRSGYLAWRTSLYKIQAAHAARLMREAGIPEPDIEQATTWISKSGLKTNPGTQALEDAACLVFLENEIAEFARQHADYPREKFIHILQKSWKKMSAPAQQHAMQLPLPPAIATLVREALDGIN